MASYGMYNCTGYSYGGGGFGGIGDWGQSLYTGLGNAMPMLTNFYNFQDTNALRGQNQYAKAALLANTQYNAAADAYKNYGLMTGRMDFLSGAEAPGEVTGRTNQTQQTVAQQPALRPSAITGQIDQTQQPALPAPQYNTYASAFGTAQQPVAAIPRYTVGSIKLYGNAPYGYNYGGL